MILVPIFAVILAIVIDVLLGDPKNKFHPTAWVGRLIGKTVPLGKNHSAKIEKLVGAVIVVSITTFVCLTLYFLTIGLGNLKSQTQSNMLSEIIFTFFSVAITGLLLKTTIAIKGMEDHAKKIIQAVSIGALNDARTKLSMIVKRNTKDLDRQHIISATLESISENTVDGITGPLFYFAIFGLPGAFIYRTVNTIDSMIGYKTDLFKNVGWFGANCDKILNYIPARLTSLVMILAIMIIRADWKKSLEIMKRDGNKTESPNAGYPMAVLAGALGAKFEKTGCYLLGDGSFELNENHFMRAVSIMKLTTVLFCIIFTIPVIILCNYIGWWIHV